MAKILAFILLALIGGSLLYVFYSHVVLAIIQMIEKTKQQS